MNPTSLRSRLALFLLLFVFGALPAASAATEVEVFQQEQVAPNFAGRWQTTYGLMELRSMPGGFTGTYNGGTASISGRLEGRRFIFVYLEPQVAGKGWFELDEQGTGFEGKWSQDGSEIGGSWKGRRVGDLARPSFEGLWQTSYGRMRLSVEGKEVTGTYLFSGTSRIEGQVEGDRLSFEYVQPNGEEGTGVFELTAGGQAFQGTWQATGASRPGKWSGTRIEAQPGKAWLVILEANWEAGLHAPEYSYGAMLRSFFSRSPNVLVRHRFVNDVADLNRWCAEVAYLAEPVVLYLSSHGTEEYIVLGDENADATQLTQALADIPNLRLLHFGSCSVLGGDVPQKISAARTESRRFPISGFTLPADWAGSALVDFTYLELVLGRGLAPFDAVRATREMLTFAKEHSGGPISGSGLSIYDAEEAAAGKQAKVEK